MKMGELFSALLCSKKDSRKLSACIIDGRNFIDKDRLYVRPWNKKIRVCSKKSIPF